MALRAFGLTGGLGSGKSTVAARLRERGVPVIDADVLAREAVAPGTPGAAAVSAAFEGLSLPDGSLDRKALAARVFGHPAELARLESIVHPRVQALRAAREAALEAAGEPLVCHEIPLLFEKGLDASLRPVVVVSVPEATQIARARARDNASEAEVRARLGAQWPLASKAARADYVIDNSGTIAETHAQTDAVLERLCEALRIDPARYRLGAR